MSGASDRKIGMVQAEKGQAIVADEPVTLDEYRGMAAQKSTEVRRRLREVEADQADLRRRQGELEDHAAAAPSETWSEAAEKARYLIQLFAATPEARAPRRRKLIAQVLDDFARLSRSPE
jgi:phosphoribosylaminoimidazole-succinocarboxamide synthase